MDLRGYERTKFMFAEILQSIQTAKAVEGDRLLYERLKDLFVRLAEDRFNLAVVGGFSRGKSSLMNAILGLDRLPTGILPLTSVITTVSYETTEKVTLKHQERRLDLTIGLDELPRYVTQWGNPGNGMGIATANIALPAEILRRGFCFVDTPGLGSSVSENTSTTKAYFPELDAMLLVTSFESPLSDDEFSVYKAAVDAAVPVFVAINKLDLVAPAERDEVIDFVRSRLAPIASQVAIYLVSAKDGLTAKQSGNADRQRDSGVPALEKRLVQFMSKRRFRPIEMAVF